jgi:hypothetical protein
LCADFFEPDQIVQLDAVPGQRPGVVALKGEFTALHEAALGDIIAVISTYAIRPEFINASLLKASRRYDMQQEAEPSVSWPR